MKRKWIFLVPLMFLGFLLFIALGGAVVRLLWNWLLPPLFGLPQITLWQALGLLALCRILFGGFGLHGSTRSGSRRCRAARWDHMTAEERERFRQRMSERWDLRASTSESRGDKADHPADELQ